MLLKILHFAAGFLLMACANPHQELKNAIDIEWPRQNELITGDSLTFRIRLSGFANGIMKVSLTNREGVSLLPPQTFEIKQSDLLEGKFSLNNLNYNGEAKLTALLKDGARYQTKSVMIRLSVVVDYEDAFVLFRPSSTAVRLIVFTTNGVIKVDRQLALSGSEMVAWSKETQVLSWISASRGSMLASKYPFDTISYVVTAAGSPFEIVHLSNNAGQFWLSEKSGSVRAIRAADGSIDMSIQGNPDTVAYAFGFSNTYLASANRWGANRAALKIYYLASGNLQSLWPLTGKVLDMRWRNDNELELALKRVSAIDKYLISIEPPALRLLGTLAAGPSDSVCYAFDNHLIFCSPDKLTLVDASGAVLWQSYFARPPVIIARKASSLWVQSGSLLTELDVKGRILHQLIMPIGEAETYLVIFAPIKPQ